MTCVSVYTGGEGVCATVWCTIIIHVCIYSLSVLYKKIYSASVVYTILSQSVLTKPLVYDAEIHNNASVLVLLLVVPCGWLSK